MRLALTTSALIPGGGQKASSEGAAKGLGGQVFGRAFYSVLAISFPSAHLVDFRGLWAQGEAGQWELLWTPSVLLSDPGNSTGQTRWGECASTCPHGSRDCNSLGSRLQVKPQSGLLLAQTPACEGVLEAAQCQLLF